MRRSTLIAISVLLLLCACTAQADRGDSSNDAVTFAADEIQEDSQHIATDSEASSSDADTESPADTIVLETPLPLGTGKTTPVDGSEIFVLLEMTRGSFNVEDSGWMSAYVGEFQFRTYSADHTYQADRYENATISPMEPKSGDPYGFVGPFSLIFDDYNGDGNPDFAVGQWGASVWRTFELFTVMPSGEVKKLPGDVIYSAELRDHSAALHKVSPTSFSTLMPYARIDNHEFIKLSQADIDAWIAGGYAFVEEIEIFYEWQGDEFQLVKSLPFDLEQLQEWKNESATPDCNAQD